MTTAATRIWTLASVMIMIVVVALGWFLGMSPKLADAARFDAERQSVQVQNDVARAVIAQLQADFDNLDELLLELEGLREEFPTDAQYDDAVRELLTGLLSAGLGLQNIAINEPAPTTAAVLEAGVEPPPTEVDGDGVLPAGSLLRVPVAVTVNGPLASILAYIDALQKSPRFSIVTQGDYAATAADSGSMTVTMLMYVVSGDDLVNPAPEVEPEPEPEPTDTATPVPTDSGSPTPTPTPTP
jgi:Tfp pilus assembly protein PilO